MDVSQTTRLSIVGKWMVFQVVDEDILRSDCNLVRSGSCTCASANALKSMAETVVGRWQWDRAPATVFCGHSTTAPSAKLHCRVHH